MEVPRRMVRPLCSCHGEPMLKNNSHGGWRCKVKHRQREQLHYIERGWKTTRIRALRSKRVRVVAALNELGGNVD